MIKLVGLFDRVVGCSAEKFKTMIRLRPEDIMAYWDEDHGKTTIVMRNDMHFEVEKSSCELDLILKRETF